MFRTTHFHFTIYQTKHDRGLYKKKNYSIRAAVYIYIYIVGIVPVRSFVRININCYREGGNNVESHGRRYSRFRNNV